MGYEISVALAWQKLEDLTCQDASVRFLGRNYLVRMSERKIIEQPGGSPADEMQMVLILHYLIGMAEKGYRPTGEWISFKEAPAGKTFWPAFVKSCIKPLLGKFEKDPEGTIRNLQSKLACCSIEGGDVALEMQVLPEIFLRMIFWNRDEDLPAGVALLFDRGLLDIYCTENVAVLLMAAAKEAERIEEVTGK